MTGRPWFWLSVWAVMLAGLTAGLWAWTAEPVAVLSLGGAALMTAIIAAYLALRPRPAAGETGEEVRVSPDSSYSALIVGVALANLVMGFEFGPWLVLASAALLLVGLGGYLNERRSARRASRGVESGAAQGPDSGQRGESRA